MTETHEWFFKEIEKEFAEYQKEFETRDSIAKESINEFFNCLNGNMEFIRKMFKYEEEDIRTELRLETQELEEGISFKFRGKRYQIKPKS